MTPERWNKIKALFSSAQNCPEGDRDEFLSRECKGDAELRSEVERLLDSYREDDEFLQDSAIAEAVSIFGDGGETAMFTAPPRFEPGMVLGDRYEIERLLGRGGMGEVYLADDTRIHRKVALKVLHSEMVSSKDSLRRFALETQAVSALNHPHIMTIYEFDTTEDGTLFFVAEYVDGVTLNHLIGKDLSLDKSLDIAIQVSSALSAAHEAGITHRDVKPENIMVRRDGYVKVLDFGLAKLTQKPASPSSSGPEAPTEALQKTRPGAVMGTASYMSPEQARGLSVDARTDIWGLGAVVYEMVTGRRPFPGDTSADIIVAVLSNEPEPLASYVAELPSELDWIITKALSKDVEARYQTSKGLRSDLERVRKRIDLDHSLKRSASGNIHPDEVRPTLDEGVATAGDETKTTNGVRETDVPAGSSIVPLVSTVGRGRSFGWLAAVAGVVIAATVSLGGYLYFAPRASAQIDSIAVLPFENLSGNPDLTYASDGISGSLIDRMSKLPQLKVISRNSSFKFRGPNVDVREVAKQLNVRAIVTGSVAQIGEDLSIRVDIVDATDDRHLGGGQYRRKASELPQIQNEIALAAAEQLRVQLTSSQTKELRKSRTDNDEADRYYLNGLVELHGADGAHGKALEYFEQATKLDPDFAAAYAEIGWVHYAEANASEHPAERMPKARAATERALALDPELAKAHTVRAMIHEGEFDWANAEREYRRAIELSPNLDFARNNYAFFLSIMDRQDQALAELEEQRLRDPLNQRMLHLQRAIILVQARRFDQALEAYSQAETVDKSKPVPHFALAYAYAGSGNRPEAERRYKAAIEDLGGDQKYSQPLVYLTALYADMPDKTDEARSMLSRIEAMQQYVSPAIMAIPHASLGEDDKAIELLERAYLKRDILLRYIGVAYEYDALRKDPRFVDLLRRMQFTSN